MSLNFNKILALVFVALIIVSTFTGVVSADINDANENDFSDNTCCVTSQALATPNKLFGMTIVSQEELDNDEFFKEVEDDEDFNWAYESINNKSDYQLKNSIKEIYADGSVGIFATFISEEGKAINLIRASKDNQSRLVLMKIEATNLTIIDRDGSVTIDTLNGSVISAGGLYSGGNGPNWVDCTIAGIGDWVSFVAIVAGIPFCYIACAAVLVPEPATPFEIAGCLVCAGSVAVVSIGRPMVQCLLNNCAYGEECKDRNQIIEEPYCYDANTVVWRYCSNDCKIEPGIKHCLSGCSNGKCNEDDPGGDKPDDSFDVSDAFYPKSSRSGNSFETTSCVAILSRGFDTSLALLLTEFNEPSVLIDQDFSPSIVDDYPILAIPTGGLYGLDSSSTFKSNLEEYVKNGGTLIVFSQQHGYEYSALPWGELSGFGWIEDQSCHHRSVYIDTYHPILSGQDSVTSDVTVDGYFTKYPENATILLSRTKNGMPAMLMYEYGNGTVIASTIYTDWAYGHHQITQDGKNLVRNMITWAKDPKNITEFAPQDVVVIPINITNCGNTTTDKVFFSITSPTTTVNYTIMNLSLLPNETKTVNFTYAAPSELGIWSIYYFLLINLSVQQGIERFAVSKYAENPDGFVYHGKDITFTISSPEEQYAYGSDVPFTIHIYNHREVDRNISFTTCYKDWMLRTKLPEQNVEGSLNVPAGGEASATYTLHVGDISLSHNQLIIYASFYEDGSNLGRTEKVVWMFRPSVSVHVETDQKEYAKGEDVSVLLNVTNKRSAACNTTITVRTLDPDNNKVFEDTFSANLSAYESLTKTLSFTLSTTAEYGTYIVTAEAYSNGDKIGSGSTYFEVLKDYIVKVSFDKPDKSYRIRENMNIDLEVTNIGSALWSSTINISIPILAFEDSRYVSLNPNQTETINYNLNIPGTIPAGKHDVTVTIGFDNSVKQYYFVIPDSNLVLSSEKTSYNAGDYLYFNLTNIGGVDTTCNCTIKFYDSRRFKIYENNTQESILAGGTKTITFEIPEQAVSGKYYLIVWCKDLNTNKITSLSKSYTITGLKAALTSVTDKKTYFIDENISIFTNITNLDGGIVNGTLEMQIFSRGNGVSTEIADSAGKEFFLVYTDNYDDGPGSAIFITSDVDTSGIVEIPGIGFSQLFTVIANTITTVNIPTSAEVQGSDIIDNKGIRVTAEDEVTVYFLNPRVPVYTNDAYLGLPVDALNVEYIILAYQDTLCEGGHCGVGPSEFAIVAPYNNTTITITPSITIGGGTGTEGILSSHGFDASRVPSKSVIHSYNNTTSKSITQNTLTSSKIAGVPYTITLDQFQTYTLQSDDTLEDLTGTIIESDHPVAVFAGVRCVFIPAGYYACDHIVEQMIPTVSWGKDFDTFPFIPRLNGLGDVLRILASVDGTVVTINGTVTGTINRGEFLEINVTNPLEISTSEPVLVAQYLTGQEYEGRIGDPFECLIPPTEQFLPKYTFITPTGYAENYVNVITPTSSLDDLLLDGFSVNTSIFTPFGTRGLSAGTIALSEGTHTISGSAPFGIYAYGYNSAVSYGYPGGLALRILQEELVWQKNITLNLSDFETKNVITEISIPNEIQNVTGKLDLLATLRTNTSQMINQSDVHSFFITDKNVSLTLETDKEIYKPNEAVEIFGEVQNNANITGNYNFSLEKDGVEIFSDAFALDPADVYNFTTYTTSNTSFTLEAMVDGILVSDFVEVETPNVNVSVIAPDVVGLGDVDIGISIENNGNIAVDLDVSINSTWNITIPGGESRLLETTMSITENTTLNVTISGDVNMLIQKEIICGENARINVTPQNAYFEGLVEIHLTVENTGILDTEFNATFTINDQSITRAFSVPEGQTINDTLSFNLTKGSYTLKYISPFEEGNVSFNVAMPKFAVTSVPANMTFDLGANVTMTFGVRNIGTAEDLAELNLTIPGIYEDTNSTWIMPGEEKNISFYFVMPDDLEEKSYKAFYEVNGEKGKFYFFVLGANITVSAYLDKRLYEENETAVLTLNIENNRNMDLCLYSRVKYNEYENTTHFNLTGLGSKTLIFNVPVKFGGDNKVLYTVYTDSGRALYINSMYIYEKQPEISLYTDKDVYNEGEDVTIHIDVTEVDLLNLTAPNFTYSNTISGSITLDFTLPELRSGTYYIEYTFGNFSSTYPFDVIGYSARILEASLDKGEYRDGDTMKLKMNIEANRNVSGIFRTGIYDPEGNLLDNFEVNITLTKGENEIEVSRVVSTNISGIHVMVYGFYTDLSGHSLTLLASGAEYYDVEGAGFYASLAAGWNLISVPLNLTTWQLGEESVVGNPLSVTPKNSLTSIYRYSTTTGLFDKCDHLDDWGWWPATGAESFTELEPCRGYWVWAKNDCNLTFTGTAPSDQEISLGANWNLIGWYSLEAALLGQESVVGNPLNVTPKNSLTSIYRYNISTGLFEKSDHLDDWGWWPATGSEWFTDLEPGSGYWVWAEDACVWRHEV